MCKFCSGCSGFPTLCYGQSAGSFATAGLICLNELLLLLQKQRSITLLLLLLCVTATVLLLRH